MHQTLEDLESDLSSFLTLSPLTIINRDHLLSHGIDKLVYTAQFGPEEVQKRAQEMIRDLSVLSHCPSSSTSKLYSHRLTNHLSFTTPAFNIRTLTYDLARCLFRLMKQTKTSSVVFELSKSERGYTEQTFPQFTSSILAAAIKEGYIGPVFMQADHTQVDLENYKKDAVGELNHLKSLIKEAIQSGMRNIDIDASTLVDLSKPTSIEQQKDNIIITAELINSARMHEKSEYPLTIGGEVGHIGEQNTTKEEVEVFLSEVKKRLEKDGMQKLSIQTGTTHGGIVSKEGETQKMEVDFALLSDIASIVSPYELLGVVQHGASTLPLTLFSSFPASHTLEIHLSTHMQNILFETLPQEIKETLENWTLEKHPHTDMKLSKEQHLYKTRKFSLGEHKQLLWEMPSEEKEAFLTSASAYFSSLFESLQIHNTKEITDSLYETT